MADLDFGRLKLELGNDLGDAFGKVQATVGGGLERIAGMGQNAGNSLAGIAQMGGGGNPLARITQMGSGGGDPLARIAGYGQYGDAGGGLDFFGALGGTDPFAAFNRAMASSQESAKDQPKTLPGGQQGPVNPGGSALGTRGSWGNHEPYRPLIEKYAAQHGVDPDAVAAYLRIETPSGNPNLTSPAGAMGLAQVMPFHFKPGENPYDPDTNLRVGIAYFAEQYKRFGDYGLASAAYHGGPGAIVNGVPRDDNSDGNVTSAGYAKMWNDYYAQIKATAPAPTAVGGSGLASLFGGANAPMTQAFGRTDWSTGAGAPIYDFGSEMGLDGDSHTGWDITPARGTQFYMPAGLSGEVIISGRGPGGYFYTNDQGPGDGKGEIRIRLDNGMEVIFGHNDRNAVQAGQRVTAGQLLGNTGDHLHVEVRVPDRSTPSGWRIVDPATLFGQR